MEASLFLPLNKKEARAKGWDEVDFVLISGDAYVDHPSFGTALIGRLLENEGFGSAFWRSLIGGSYAIFKCLANRASLYSRERQY